MRIGLVAPYDWAVPGGVQRHIAALDRVFREEGHEVKIIAANSSHRRPKEPPPANLIRVGGAVVPVSTSGSRVRVALSPRLYRQLKGILVRQHFDVIHVHEPLMPAVALLALHHAHVHPSTLAVGTFHAYREENPGYEYGAPVFRRLMARLEGRIAVSEAARDYVAYYFPGNYRLIPNGVDLGCFGQSDVAPIPRFHNQRPKILFVGRLERRKGFVHLLNAFCVVRRTLPDAQLIVAGAYDRKDAAPFILQARAARMSGISFLGWQPDEKLARLYHTADVVCVPSTGFESFGMVLVEAMAAGRPIVASNIPGYREVVRDGIEGLLVPPEDEAALARALVTLLTDKDLRQHLGHNGRVRASRYAWSRVADEVLGYYQELNEQRGQDSWHLSSKKPEI